MDAAVGAQNFEPNLWHPIGLPACHSGRRAGIHLPFFAYAGRKGYQFDILAYSIFWAEAVHSCPLELNSVGAVDDDCHSANWVACLSALGGKACKSSIYSLFRNRLLLTLRDSADKIMQMILDILISK